MIYEYDKAVEKGFDDIYAEADENSLIRKLFSRVSRSMNSHYFLDLLSEDNNDYARLYDWAKENDNRSLMNFLSQVVKAVEEPATSHLTRVPPFAKGVLELIKNQHIKGWLFKINGKLLDAYLVKEIRIHEKNNTNDNPYVTVSICAYNPRNKDSNGFHRETIYFTLETIRQKKTLHEIFMDKGFFFETERLHEYYENNLKKYLSIRPKHNEQFWFKGALDSNGRNTAIKTNPKPTRAVNEEGIFDCPLVYKTNSDFWKKQGYGSDFEDIPVHPYVYMYSLDLHRDFFAHTSLLEDYVYDKTLKDKLILPATHRNLIDILVNDMDVLQEDIVRGKSGGTTVLCTGTPGLGKTLTSEVYSEVIERPLYRVQSGQLGASISNIESTLKSILDRASRWGAVLLIDEADVYIRQRDNSMEHNAIVATFLRTLEYFSGLLFLTTNRGDDVDDAIVSRCIAVIDYQTPDKESAVKIWKVLSQQYGANLSDTLIAELVETYPKASGRDIKELLKLTTRYVKAKQLEYNTDVFMDMAQFRRSLK